MKEGRKKSTPGACRRTDLEVGNGLLELDDLGLQLENGGICSFHRVEYKVLGGDQRAENNYGNKYCRRQAHTASAKANSRKNPRRQTCDRAKVAIARGAAGRAMKKSPRTGGGGDDNGTRNAPVRDEDDETASFAGAVGFFDASETTVGERRRDSFDFGVMGFFECLDTKAEKALGVSQTTFSHDGSGGQSMEWTALVDALSKQPALQKILVRNNKLLSADMQVLSGTLIKFHQLHVIDFSGNPLGVRGLGTLLDCCRGNIELAELHLSDIGIGDAAEHELEVVCRTLDDFPSLRVLNVSSNNLSMDVMRALALSANDHPSLNRLYLERNNITAANAAEIVRFLPGNMHLHTLYTSNLKHKVRAPTVMSNPLRLLKRGFSNSGKMALVEAVANNVALRNVQIDGVSAQEQSRLSAVLSQNEKLWALRGTAGASGRASLANRGIGFVPDVVFSLVLLAELDLSNNNLEAVPMQFTSLKNLQWLSLEKNDISSAALPIHLHELKKLRHLNLSGNPCAAELPKDCPADNAMALFSLFRTLLDRDDMFEGQAAVMFASAVSGDATKLSSEVERLNKRSKMGLLKLVRSPVSSTFKYAIQARLLPSAEVAVASKRTVRGGRMSFRSASTLDLGAGHSCLWGVMRECEVALFPIFALFHRVVVFCADVSVPDWESRARDVLSVLTPSVRLPYVIIVLTGGNVGLLSVDARRILVTAVQGRFKRFGVQDVVPMAGELDMNQLHDTISNAVLSEIDTNILVPRSMVSMVASLSNRSVVGAPSIPLSSFSSVGEQKALRWAQNAGLLSMPLPGGVVCSNLVWALGCLEAVTDLEASVFEKDDLRVVFASDSFSEPSRVLSLRVLEAANAIVRTGWLHDQWIIQNQLQHAAPLSAQFMQTLAQVPAGATMVTRLYRIISPIVEVSVSSVIRKVFLQTAGVLSDIISVSATGFSGSLVLKDVVYVVRVSIEQSGSLTVVVDLHTDLSGQVVHMVTTAIERGLDEEQHKYLRLYLNEYKKESDLDVEIGELVKARTRVELTNQIASKKMLAIPDLALLGAERLFWDEFAIEVVIGKGSFGEVSLATVKATKAKIAVKMMSKKKPSDQANGSLSSTTSSGLREILRELWVLSVLQHPNIVSPAGVCLEPLAVCMEHMALGDLRAFLERHGNGPIPWHVRHSLLMDIASGMEYAHGQRPPLVHSDLKSPNILLCAQDGALVAKIADLGMASFSSLNTVAAVDNPLWSAPEMIQHTMCAPSVDVYSFAIIAWEICSGNFPFTNELADLDGSIPKLREAIIAGKRPDMLLIHASDIPAEALPLIRECWSDPPQRPSFRQILARLTDMVVPSPSAQSPQKSGSDVSLSPTPARLFQTVTGMRLFMPTHASYEPKTICFLGGAGIVLRSDGMLVLLDRETLSFARVLRWKLTERVRMASSAVLGQDAFFAYGADSLFVLSDNLAARRVVGDLTCCDLVCAVGADALAVAGRNEAGVALQTFRFGSWEGKSWNLSDTRSPIVALAAVSDSEMWSVSLVDQASSLVSAMVTSNPRVVRKSNVFPEKISAIARLPWSSDEVWMCGSQKVLCVSRDSLAVVSTISLGIRAPLPIVVAQESYLFGYSDGTGCLFDRQGNAKFRAVVKTKDVEPLVDASTALQVPGSPHVIVAWSRFGLCSWRLDVYEPCPKELIATPFGALPLRPKQGSGGSNAGSTGTKTSSGGSGSSGGKETSKSKLHMTRKGLVRATVTCDDTGKIISCNRGVMDIFGHDPSLLVGTSVRTLFFVPRTRERAGSILLYSRQTSQHFSASDLWKSIMADLLKVRVVNGQCKDGSQVPLLISSSEMVVGGKPLYVLLFEQLSRKCAILVVDETGVITSATENLPKVLGWNADRVQGKAITTIVTAPPPRRFLNGRLFDPSDNISAQAVTASGQTITCLLQVVEFANCTYTIVCSLPSTDKSVPDTTFSEQLSHYQLGRVLGKGMCGEVREGTHKLTGSKIAIKRIRQKDFEAAGVKFSRLEVDLMRGMDHPNVVQLLDCVSLPSEILLVLELISGGELFSYCMDK